MEQTLNEMSVEETKAFILSDTVKYFRDFLEETGDSLNVFDYNSNPESINGFELKEVYSEGGYEGGGEHAEVVVGIFHEATEPSPIAYVRIVGFYNSYAGTEWDESSTARVYPREVVVTQYFNEP